MKLQLSPQPRLETLLETIQQVEAFARAHCKWAADVYALTVTVEELLTSTLMFGFENTPAPHLSIHMYATGNKVVCTIFDSGAPFDPRSPNPAAASGKTHARQDAFPFALMQKTARGLEWRYEDGRNIVHVEYPGPGPASEMPSRARRDQRTGTSE